MFPNETPLMHVDGFKFVVARGLWGSGVVKGPKNKFEARDAGTHGQLQQNINVHIVAWRELLEYMISCGLMDPVTQCSTYIVEEHAESVRQLSRILVAGAVPACHSFKPEKDHTVCPTGANAHCCP